MQNKMDVSTWFNLTYASYLVLPRLWFESMPIEWQYKFTKLLNEVLETLEIDTNFEATYTVNHTVNGKFAKDPYRDYRRGVIKCKAVSGG
jgi:hypothetical protein